MPTPRMSKNKIIRVWGNKLLFLFIPISAIFLFVFSLTPPAEAVKYYWTSELIENIGGGVSSNGIARDPGDGTIYATYYNSGSGLNDVRLATKSGGSWSIQSIATPASWNDLKRDSSGNLHLVYYSAGILRYGFKPSAGSWTFETANATSASGQYVSIELDASGNPHVPLNQVTGGGNSLRHDFKSSGAWSDELVASNTYPEYPDMAFDNSGVAYIAYSHDPPPTGGGYELRVASNAGGTWSTNELVASSGVPRWPSFAIDSSNNLHLSYGVSPGGLKYAYKPFGGSWAIETVDATYGAYTEMALDPNGNPVILYQGNNGYLKIATKSDGSWSVASVGSEKTDMVSMTLDSSGNIYAVYNSYVGVSTERFAVGEQGNLINGLNENIVLTGSYGVPVTASSITVTGDGRLVKDWAAFPEADFLVASFVGDVYSRMELYLEDSTLSGTATLVFDYTDVLSDPDFIATGFGEEHLKIFRTDGLGFVEELPVVSRNLAANTITVTTTSFSDFGIGVNPEPATLVLLGSGLLGLLPLRRKMKL